MNTFIIYSVILLWALVLFNTFLLFLLFRQFGQVYLNTGKGIARDGIAFGQPIPRYNIFSLTKNKDVLMEDFLGKKPALIAFISPTCKPCMELLPDWKEKESTQNGKINFITVVVGEERKVYDLLKKREIAGEVLWDKNKELFSAFKVRVTPFAFAVNELGLVKDKGLCGSNEQIDFLLSSIIHDTKTEKVAD
ncbi:MAG: redoxin domain-containing protein [Bacillus sp. (in: Bacteria)]|nr:redoxin domain-containing protein [Bacillus sp. (in: firmicutes)]